MVPAEVAAHRMGPSIVTIGIEHGAATPLRRTAFRLPYHALEPSFTHPSTAVSGPHAPGKSSPDPRPETDSWIVSCSAARSCVRDLEADELDALLVSSPTNVSYLTGFTGDSSVLLVGRDRDLIISDGRFTTQLEQECPGLEAHIRPPGQEMNPAIAQVVSSRWGCDGSASRRRS